MVGAEPTLYGLPVFPVSFPGDKFLEKFTVHLIRSRVNIELSGYFTCQLYVPATFEKNCLTHRETISKNEEIQVSQFKNAIVSGSFHRISGKIRPLPKFWISSLAVKANTPLMQLEKSDEDMDL
jgi:hypothetical protein